MIATLKPPKNKHELAKAILSLKNPKIDVLEVLSINDKLLGCLTSMLAEVL